MKLVTTNSSFWRVWGDSLRVTLTRSNLLTPADEHSNHMVVARQVVPILLDKTKEVLHKFLADDKISGTLPLPRARLSEVAFVLRHLKSLQIHPEIMEKISTSNAPPTPNFFYKGSKQHLLNIFPVLCDFITVKESETKEILKGLFLEIAKEIGIAL